MKACSVIVLALATVGFAPDATAQAGRGASPLRVGAAKVDVTPAEGELPRNSRGILDRLYARAIVLESGASSAALVTVDAGTISTAIWQAATGQIEKELGIPATSVLVTVYLFWTVLAERLLTLRQACGAVLISAAFAAAWVMVLSAAGVPLGTMSTTDAFSMLSPALLPLMASVLAPWSLSRVRHT